MDRSQKDAFISDIRASLAGRTLVVVTHHSGLTVEEITDLRRKMRTSEVGFKVVKNNLARRAIAQTPHEKLDEWLVGPTALAFSTDPVAAAKVAVKFSEGNDKLQVVGGILGEQKLDKAAVIALAKLPSLDELRAKFLAVLNAPASQIARILVEPGTRVARVIHAHGSAA